MSATTSNRKYRFSTLPTARQSQFDLELVSNKTVRKAGWCPECKQRLEQCECGFYAELPLEVGGK